MTKKDLTCLARQTKIKVELPKPSWGKVVAWGVYDASLPIRVLKISWTYYGLQFRLLEFNDHRLTIDNVHYQEEYMMKDKTLAECRNDPEMFAGYLQAIEERLNDTMDNYISNEKDGMRDLI